MKMCFLIFMKNIVAGIEEGDEPLQVQVPAVTKRDLGQRALDTREPLRMVVLRALHAYGVTVPVEAITDRRRRNR